MNEVVQRLIEKTGLPEAKAEAAAQTVIGYMKEKLPGPVSSQIDNLMSGGSGASGNLGGIGSKIGGMFGGNE